MRLAITLRFAPGKKSPLTSAAVFVSVTGESNSQMVSLTDELSQRNEELLRHQEEIAQLLSQIVELQHRVKEVTHRAQVSLYLLLLSQQ